MLEQKGKIKRKGDAQASIRTLDLLLETCSFYQLLFVVLVLLLWSRFSYSLKPAGEKEIWAGPKIQSNPASVPSCACATILMS